MLRDLRTALIPFGLFVLFLLVLALLPGCVVGPRGWSEWEHVDMLGACQATCSNRMQSYTPNTGECVCSAAPR